MFYFSQWMELPLGTRNTIAGYLGIIKKGSIEVVDNKVVRDGYNLKDIEAVMTVQNLQRFLNSDEHEFEVLWNILVNKAEGRAIPVLAVNLEPATPIAIVAISDIPAPEEKKKPGRKSKINNDEKK